MHSYTVFRIDEGGEEAEKIRGPQGPKILYPGLVIDTVYYYVDYQIMYCITYTVYGI